MPALGRARGLAASCALSWAFFPATARAEDEAAEVREAPCVLPDGIARRLVTTREAPTCGSHACAVEQSQVVVDENDARWFGISEVIGEDETGVRLSCGERGLTLELDGSALHLVVQRGLPTLEPAEAKAIRKTWNEPATGKPERIDRLQSLQALVRTALESEDAVDGVEQELVDVLELVEVRERIKAGDFENAQARLTQLAGRPHASAKAALPPAVSPLAGRPPLRFGMPAPEPPLSAESRKRHAELVRLLETTRAKSSRVKLGPRRLVGRGPRFLRGPAEIGEVPTLFFESGKLCIGDVAPDLSGLAPETLAPPPKGRMRCFAPNAAPPAADEPYRAPPSSGLKLAYRDFTSPYNQCRGMVVAIHVGSPPGPHPCQGGPGVAFEDVLAVVDGDALLTLGSGGLELVRGPGKPEKIAPDALSAVVARSAGTRLFVKGSSYFLERGRLARVGQSEDKTWLVLGPPPAGAYWMGTPVVSPDQRWVAVQSGTNDRDVEVWVFPVLAGGRPD